jgi:hypothetical protein
MSLFFKILKFISKEIIAKTFYNLFLLFLDPRLFYKTIILYNINIIVTKFNNLRKNLNYKNIKDYLIIKVKSLFAIKGIILLIRIILYLNAIFGAGVILFHVNPFTELLNNIINLINYYSDNPIFNSILTYWYSLLKKIKTILDSFSKLIEGIIPNDKINSFNDNLSIFKNSNESISSSPSIPTEIRNNFELDDYNLRKNYSLTNPNENYPTENINNYNFKKWTLIIGTVLVIGGLVIYNWDSILYYFTYNNYNNSDSKSLIDLSPANSEKSLPNTDTTFFFTSPTNSNTSTPSSSGTSTPSIASIPSSSGSSTITLATQNSSTTMIPGTAEDVMVTPTSPLPLKVKISTIDKFNPSYPLADDPYSSLPIFFK